MFTDSKLGFVVFYSLLISLLLFIAPTFGENLITSGDSSELGIFSILSALIGDDIINRFLILTGISVQNPILGILMSSLSLGFFWCLIELVRGN